MEERNSQGHSHCSPCHVFQKEHGIHINWLTSSTKIATLHLYHIFIYTARLHLYRNDSECKDEIYFNSPTQKKISALSRRFKYQKIYNWNFSMSYTILTMQTLRNTTIPNWKKPAKILQHLQKKKKKGLKHPTHLFNKETFISTRNVIEAASDCKISPTLPHPSHQRNELHVTCSHHHRGLELLFKAIWNILLQINTYQTNSQKKAEISS